MAQNLSTGNRLAFDDRSLADVMEFRAKTTVDAPPGVLSVVDILTTHHLRARRRDTPRPFLELTA